MEGLGQIWLIPCDGGIDIAFKIGQTYPVHPLDTSSDDALTNPDGQTCLGAVRLHVAFPSILLLKPPIPDPAHLFRRISNL